MLEHWKVVTKCSSEWNKGVRTSSIPCATRDPLRVPAPDTQLAVKRRRPPQYTTQGTYSDSVSWDRRASHTYWLRLQAKHDKSGWYNLTEEFARNEKLAHLMSQGEMNYKSEEPMEGLSPCLSLPHASAFCLAGISHVMTDLGLYFFKGDIFFLILKWF